MPFKIFISHSWHDETCYPAVIRMLNEDDTFCWKNYPLEWTQPIGAPNNHREKIERELEYHSGLGVIRQRARCPGGRIRDKVLGVAVRRGVGCAGGSQEEGVEFAGSQEDDVRMPNLRRRRDFLALAIGSVLGTARADGLQEAAVPQIGILLNTTYTTGTLEARLDEAKAHGLACVQV